MFELFETKPDIHVQEKEYKRLLGYPSHYGLNGRARQLADWARQWYAENGRPWIFARQTDSLDISNGHLLIDNTGFSSSSLQHQLAEAKAHAAMLAVVSAGRECEEKARQLWLEEKPDEYFFLEVYGSAVVEYLVTIAGARLCEWAEERGLAVLPHYSPGYTGWDVADQKQLLELILKQNGRHFPAEISILETGMLRPKKSLLAVFGITRQVERARLAEMIPCHGCAMPSCQYRRAPYKNPRRQIEDVVTLQPQVNGDGNGGTSRASLDPNVRYSVSTKALQKWSRERLRLTVLDDRSVKARFRYQGTTCSNMGRPLEFEYHITLEPPDRGYRIADATCAPAAGDDGYTYMCDYIKDSEMLMNTIENERPLPGKPLEDVFKWERQTDPAGCYCKPASRRHKWGLVLQVIHYALVQYENQGVNRQMARSI
ncbi:hypothetical protein A2V82_11775 [candidate division KSB1 bacterium RBG_16_48_16]|nr:MAG: hypothetical protein A2V82_11775 [candidate division KSB1 bacterium RBG_16_48_16]